MERSWQDEGGMHPYDMMEGGSMKPSTGCQHSGVCWNVQHRACMPLVQQCSTSHVVSRSYNPPLDTARLAARASRDLTGMHGMHQTCAAQMVSRPGWPIKAMCYVVVMSSMTG